MSRPTLVARLSRYSVINGCHVWNGSKDKDGYGYIKVDNKTTKAHRVAYSIYVGDIPSGAWILHKCDNPSCINPEHLYAGDGTQNMKDRRIRGRNTGWKGVSVKGDRNPNRILSSKDVSYIRQVYKWGMGPALAKQFNIGVIQINRIVRGVAWK